MRHASSRSSEIGRFYNLLYNFWPELSVLGLRFVKRSCRLTCDTRDVTGKVMPSPFVLLMSSFRVLTMVVLLLPQKILLVLSSKQYLIAFLAGQSSRQSQDASQQLPSSLSYGDRQWLCFCDLIQFTVGYFMWQNHSNFYFGPVKFLILTGCCKYHADIAQISPTLTRKIPGQYWTKRQDCTEQTTCKTTNYKMLAHSPQTTLHRKNNLQFCLDLSGPTLLQKIT